ncbi:MAG: four-carbon acid sugar kinase family protein [Rubrivivax sp.]|nr:four-carbon acid sugar kinase family protein [Rubrivivax sp.]
MLRLAWYGDDFTGAADTLATLASAGLRSTLFLGAPTPDQLARCGPLDAIGIAGTARALTSQAMRAELAPVAAFFAALAPPVTHYKCCSTFDSAPEVGNLAVGVAALRTPAHDPALPVLGGQPSLGRCCAFGTLFASAEAGGALHRIDRHPTMSRHPVTPMHEADLRRHLATLGLPGAALLDIRALDQADDTALDAAWGHGPLLMDSTHPAHLARIGRLLWQRALQRPVLALGASSVAQALIAHWQALGEVPAVALPGTVPAAEGPVFLLVGSQSPVTAAQVDTAAAAFDTVVLDMPALVDSDSALAAAAAQCADRLQAGRSVLARTGAPVAGGPGALAVAQAGGRLLAQVLQRAPQVRRAGVAGGDSASFALRALGPWALRWAGTLAPGVPLLEAISEQPAQQGLTLMLKGGQMGPRDIFLRLLHGTG